MAHPRGALVVSPLSAAHRGFELLAAPSFLSSAPRGSANRHAIDLGRFATCGPRAKFNGYDARPLTGTSATATATMSRRQPRSFARRTPAGVWRCESSVRADATDSLRFPRGRPRQSFTALKRFTTSIRTVPPCEDESRPSSTESQPHEILSIFRIKIRKFVPPSPIWMFSASDLAPRLCESDRSSRPSSIICKRLYAMPGTNMARCMTRESNQRHGSTWVGGSRRRDRGK